jgi:hypothetical protein
MSASELAFPALRWPRRSRMRRRITGLTTMRVAGIGGMNTSEIGTITIVSTMSIGTVVSASAESGYEFHAVTISREQHFAARLSRRIDGLR